LRLSPEEARARFAAARVARLASVDAAGQPHLVPVTFVVIDDRVFHAVDRKPKRTTGLKRLRNIAATGMVALLCDYYDDDWARLWWVRADGRAELWTDTTRCASVFAALRAKYPQYVREPPVGPVVAVRVERWSGWAASQPGHGGRDSSVSTV